MVYGGKNHPCDSYNGSFFTSPFANALVFVFVVRIYVRFHGSMGMDQKEYQERYTGLVVRYEEIKRAISENCTKRQERSTKKESIKDFIRMLEKNKALLAEFDEEVWNATVESVYIHADKKITFAFKNGLELDWNI